VQFGNTHFLFSSEVFSTFPIVTPIGKSPNKKAVNPHTFTGAALFFSRLRERIITFIHGLTTAALHKGVGVKVRYIPSAA